ncbi:MAG TPA: hypothetical protein VES79_10390 [Solirubrobacteraceae bacterium]|nr:hypothetical protein [Solirubrobacteraceae bacterium]
MPDPLPPDLSRLGDEIVAAAERLVRARRRRVALLERGAVAAAAALILAAGVPGALAPAVRTGEPQSLASIASTGAEDDLRPGCDHLRSATFAYPRPCRRAGEARSPSVLRPEADLRLIQRRQ